jgi:hypothetical protein
MAVLPATNVANHLTKYFRQITPRKCPASHFLDPETIKNVWLKVFHPEIDLKCMLISG